MAFKINETVICIYHGKWIETKPGYEIMIPGPHYLETVTVKGFDTDGGLFLKEYPIGKQGYDPTSFRSMTAKERAEYMVKNELIPLTNPQPQTA